MVSIYDGCLLVYLAEGHHSGQHLPELLKLRCKGYSHLRTFDNWTLKDCLIILEFRELWGVDSFLAKLFKRKRLPGNDSYRISAETKFEKLDSLLMKYSLVLIWYIRNKGECFTQWWSTQKRASKLRRSRVFFKTLLRIHSRYTDILEEIRGKRLLNLSKYLIMILKHISVALLQWIIDDIEGYKCRSYFSLHQFVNSYSPVTNKILIKQKYFHKSFDRLTVATFKLPSIRVRHQLFVNSWFFRVIKQCILWLNFRL